MVTIRITNYDYICIQNQYGLGSKWIVLRVVLGMVVVQGKGNRYIIGVLTWDVWIGRGRVKDKYEHVFQDFSNNVAEKVSETDMFFEMIFISYIAHKKKKRLL